MSDTGTKLTLGGQGDAQERIGPAADADELDAARQSRLSVRPHGIEMAGWPVRLNG